MFLLPHAVTAVLGVLLIGLGYGPSPAAGSEVLQRYSPPDRRSLIFSVKQAGVPAGGVLAGLVLPPAILTFGVTGAVACCLIVSLAAMALVQPLRAEVDAERETGQRIDIGSVFAAGNLLAPLRAVVASPEIALAGGVFRGWPGDLVRLSGYLHGAATRLQPRVRRHGVRGNAGDRHLWTRRTRLAC
jgi:hypothetical protein